MRRFYFDEEGRGDDEEDAEDMEGMGFMPEEFITMTPMSNPEHHLLDCAIKFCEKSILWRFMGNSSRLKMLEDVYVRIRNMMEGA